LKTGTTIETHTSEPDSVLNSGSRKALVAIF
jgi:hypothetical protein